MWGMGKSDLFGDQIEKGAGGGVLLDQLLLDIEGEPGQSARVAVVGDVAFLDQPGHSARRHAVRGRFAGLEVHVAVDAAELLAGLDPAGGVQAQGHVSVLPVLHVG